MNKDEKSAAVAELSDRLQEAEAIFAIDYRGISVSGAAELRTRLADADAVFKVVKNRLAKRALADAEAEAIDEHLAGPTALTLIRGDAVIAAKAISTFAREHDVLAFKGGLMDGEALDPEGFQALARLPALDVLHGQLVGVAASPITGLARGLGSMLSGLAVALGQIAEQGLVTGEAPPPADEAPADDATADEAPADDATSDEAPADEAPADEAPADDATSDEAPADEAPAEPEISEAEETTETSEADEEDGGSEPPADEAGSNDNEDDDGSSEGADPSGEASEDSESEE